VPEIRLLRTEPHKTLQNHGDVPTESGVTIPTQCPNCDRALEAQRAGELDMWVCPPACGKGGIAMTLTEAHGRLQDDEIQALWHAARNGSAGPCKSPITRQPMVRVSVPIDDDEIAEGEDGDSTNSATVTVDVDVENQFIWFDAGELDEFPNDAPNAEPSPEEQAAITRIVQHFGDEYARALDESENQTLTERLYDSLARRPHVFGAVKRITKPITPDSPKA